MADVVDALESTAALSAYFADQCENIDASTLPGLNASGLVCANKNGATARALECALEPLVTCP